MFQRSRVALSGILLALLLAGGIVTRPDAQGTETEPNGSVTSLAVDSTDGSLLMVRGGLFRSTDQGQHWTDIALPSSLHPDKLRQVATTSSAPDSVYAAGPGAGVLRSDDHGENWNLVSDGLPSQEVVSFAVHSFRPDTLYAWIENDGVFRTEDGGGRWEKMDDGPPASVVTLAHSTLEGSMNTGWLYAATPDGPYLSMDCF